MRGIFFSLIWKVSWSRKCSGGRFPGQDELSKTNCKTACWMGETWKNQGAREQRAKGRLWGGETKLRVAQSKREHDKGCAGGREGPASAAVWSARNITDGLPSPRIWIYQVLCCTYWRGNSWLALGKKDESFRGLAPMGDKGQEPVSWEKLPLTGRSKERTCAMAKV